MKKIIIFLLILIPFIAISQAVVQGPNGLVHIRDTASIGGGTGSLVKGYIDITKPPYSMVNGQDISVNLKNILDSLHTLYNSGTVYIPGNFNFGRPVGGSQKGVRLWANQHIIGNGGRITFTNDCAFANTDFGTDSLGTNITADCVDSTTYFTVASTTGMFVGDTVYIRLSTAPYDAGEPVTFGFRKITRIADATHMQLDGPAGGSLTVSGTSTLNRRIIRIHNLTTNASVENLELFNPGTGSAYMEAGVYVQGAINVTVDHVRASNPALGLACFQFCKGCVLSNSVLDSSSNLGNANAGRGATYNECENCGLINNIFNKFQRTAFVNESNNINSYGIGNTFNNNWSDSLRTIITTLGSGTFRMDNTTFTGFQQTAYDFVLSTGNLVLTNTLVPKGTPFKMYEQQGITITPPLILSDSSYYLKKTFTYKFVMPVNGTVTFDSLPKGLITSAYITLDDTTGCTSFYFRRDNSNLNNGTDFFSQLRSGRPIAPSIGASFQVGNGLPSGNLNYNENKSFSVTTNSTALANKTGTINMTYLEKNGSTVLNRYNAMTSYSSVPAVMGVTTNASSSSAAISGNYLQLYQADPTFSGLMSNTTQSFNGVKTFQSQVKLPSFSGTGSAPAITPGTGAGTSPTVSVTGTDVAMRVTVTTGTLPTAAATVATVTFSAASYPTGCIVTLTPANAVTALLTGATMVYVLGATTSYVITAGATGLTAATTYLWNVTVTGY